MRERTSERWTSSLALFPSASVHSYPSSKWCCPCTHEFLVVGFIAFLFDPLHHTCVVSVVKWVCSGGGCPLNRQEPRLQVELPVAAGETRPLNPRSAVWNPHVTLCCAVVLTPKQLASFPAPRRRGLSEVHLSVLRSTAWPVFEFQLTVKEQIHRRYFYDHSFRISSGLNA